MAKNRATDVTGDVGEHLAAAVLAPIATVERRGEGMELDYYCELREHPGCVFHVQAKGSVTPCYSQNMISSLPIKRSTIEEYWFKQPYPVYILMSDTRRGSTYRIRVSECSYQQGESETYTFRIPISNELTRENVGLLADEILRHQPQLNAQDAKRLAEDYRAQHPLLCHDLDHIDSLLEMMRGTDQHEQVKAKVAIQALTDDGELGSHRLENGLIAIFQNCKDRITQHHALDTLVALRATGASSEIIKQIDRNTRLYGAVKR